MLTAFAARGLWRVGMADGDLPVPPAFQWLFPLRGKWLYRGLLGVIVGVVLPFVFLILFGVSTLLCGIGRAALVLLR